MACDVHHVPGRIRFKIPGLRNDSSLLGALPGVLGAYEGVDRIEIREASNSLIVHYDPNRVRCHLVAETVNRALSAQNGHAIRERGGGNGSDARAARPQEDGGNGLLRGSVRQMGIVFGQAAFKVALEQAVRGGLNSLFRATLGRG
jgi:hypothetical protein